MAHDSKDQKPAHVGWPENRQVKGSSEELRKTTANIRDQVARETRVFARDAKAQEKKK